MKNNVLKYLLIVMTITVSIFCLNKAINVKADSGWDTDYDSGSSWDSSSDWDTDYDSGSSSDSDYSSGSSGSSSRCTTEECKKNRKTIALVGVISFGVIMISAFLYSFIKATIDARIKIIKEIISVIILIVVLYYSVILSAKQGPLVLVLIPITGILLVIINSKKKVKTKGKYPQIVSNHSINNYEQIKDTDANKIIPNFNIEEFNFKAYQIFYDTQIAWMNFDYDKLKEILKDELYNTYEMDLEVLKSKNQKNVMKDFKLNQIKLIGLKEVNEIYSAKVILEVEFIDFIEDAKKHKVLRGKDKEKVCNTYILTFEKSKKPIESNVCPKCGASVEGNITGVCEYCKSKIINDNYDWIMSEKLKIDQK